MCTYNTGPDERSRAHALGYMILIFFFFWTVNPVELEAYNFRQRLVGTYQAILCTRRLLANVKKKIKITQTYFTIYTTHEQQFAV